MSPRRSAPELSIVIPAYNEASRVGQTLDLIRAFVQVRHLDAEVIVVDDGSEDHTGLVVAERARDWRALRLVSSPRNAGKGEAVRRGMAASSGRFRVFTDADLSVPIEELERLLKPLREGADVAIASRAVDGARLEIPQPWYRQTMGKSFNWLVRLLVMDGIHDTQCGFKAFSANAAVSLFPPLRTRRFGFDVEILYRARRAGYVIVEVPTRWINSRQSKVRPVADSLGMLVELLAVRYRARSSKRAHRLDPELPAS